MRLGGSMEEKKKEGSYEGRKEEKRNKKKWQTGVKPGNTEWKKEIERRGKVIEIKMDIGL